MTMTGTQSPDRDDPGTRNGAVTTRLDTSFQMRFRVIDEENRITTYDVASDIRLDPGLKAILAGITVEPVGDVGPARWSGAG
jgi:hypothetical protein